MNQAAFDALIADAIKAIQATGNSPVVSGISVSEQDLENAKLCEQFGRRKNTSAPLPAPTSAMVALCF